MYIGDPAAADLPAVAGHLEGARRGPAAVCTIYFFILFSLYIYIYIYNISFLFFCFMDTYIYIYIHMYILFMLSLRSHL